MEILPQDVREKVGQTKPLNIKDAHEKNEEKTNNHVS